MESEMDIFEDRRLLGDAPLPLWERLVRRKRIRTGRPPRASSFRGRLCRKAIRDRRRLAIGSIARVIDLRQPLARGLSLALPVPHAGIKTVPCHKRDMGSTFRDP